MNTIAEIYYLLNIQDVESNSFCSSRRLLKISFFNFICSSSFCALSKLSAALIFNHPLISLLSVRFGFLSPVPSDSRADPGDRNINVDELVIVGESIIGESKFCTTVSLYSEVLYSMLVSKTKLEFCLIWRTWRSGEKKWCCLEV